MAKYRILEFSTYAKIGGTQKILLEFLRHASHERFLYTLCVLLDHDMLNEEVAALGLDHTSLKMRGYWDISVWWKLYRFAKEHHFDLIRTYGLKADIIGRVIGKLTGIAVHITSVRSTDPWRKWYHVWLDRITSGLTDLYLSNSEAGRQAVITRERIAEAKTATIPNGIDLNVFDHVHCEQAGISEKYRRQFGIPPQAPVIGVVANVCKMKGHRIILEALPRIQEAFPDLHCVFVGHDFLHGTVQRAVYERHLEKTVIFTGFRTDIPELLSMCTIFLLPSFWEGLPTALLEAMAMRKPIIATVVGGIPELLKNGYTGLLIPPGEVQALAEAVIFLLENPDVATKMANAAYEHVRQHFSIEAMVEKTEKLYVSCIEEKKLQPNK